MIRKVKIPGCSPKATKKQRAALKAAGVLFPSNVTCKRASQLIKRSRKKEVQIEEL